MMLSPHFSYAEMTRTSVRQPNNPGLYELRNLKRLCQVLELVRAVRIPRLDCTVGPIWIDSGYRCPSVNVMVGGSRVPPSAHIDGRAADYVPMDREITIVDLFEALIASDVPFDKIIFEAPISPLHKWVHMQIRKDDGAPRHEAWMSLEHGKYALWNPSLVGEAYRHA